MEQVEVNLRWKKYTHIEWSVRFPYQCIVILERNKLENILDSAR